MKCKQIKGWSCALLDTKAWGNIRQSVNLRTQLKYEGGKKPSATLQKERGKSNI